MSKGITDELTVIIDEVIRDLGIHDYYRSPVLSCSGADDSRYAELREMIGEWVMLPEDYLPEAVSVLSVFVPFAMDAVVDSRGPDHGLHKWVKAHHYIYDYREDIATAVCSYFAGKGFKAVSIEGKTIRDGSGKHSTWSHKSAAVITGLGRFGANHTVITRKGSAGAMFTFVTDASIPVNKSEAPEYCDYLKDGSCHICFDSCPIGALTPEGIDIIRCDAMIEAHLNDEDDYYDTSVVCIWGNCYRQCPYAYIE